MDHRPSEELMMTAGTKTMASSASGSVRMYECVIPSMRLGRTASADDSRLQGLAREDTQVTRKQAGLSYEYNVVKVPAVLVPT
ncbi:hypothetical protein TgHK011_007688 [Trichoderma gracile]|nr:hypothetical protein TgHK011_007688 [Trichoderma gracile]